ncbi:haloacid dehalogenase [Actinomadura rubrobrunea]|uniref:D,D-heptose 1,7-bisphosphate phosphatase n=1 Tax=Actinomadura rubrobrunea TaxID=115335 RepID=A0A9W6UX76_9ACTN|nr:HAD-IIIA family hydrolase [Actinomadura rubrobrunea]GLW67396.1 haloacid dehalogenase [Actinomadura rubrobrunea]
MRRADYTVVIPTVGRASLRTLLDALLDAAAADPGGAPAEILVVDDRARPGAPLPLPSAAGRDLRVLRSGGRGPAAARNVGWRAAATEWAAFLDDDVVPAPDWTAKAAADLADQPGDVGGSQGAVAVPPPEGRRPTDWERGTAGLADASWITADMAYRRRVLAEVGGFDERFRRAYREDADLALRVMAAGHRLVRGARTVTHPVRPAGFWTSVRAQAGNADDVLMRRLHGRDWRRRAGETPGRFRRHLLTTASGLLAAAAYAAGGRRVALPAAVAWAGLTAEFAAARILPGPRTPGETARMVVTSAVIPPAAVWHRLRGLLAHARAGPWCGDRAVLFDRDDTLVRDVPYNGDPERVRPVPGAREALDRLRRRGVRIGVVSNQSGVARGLITRADVRRVNERIEELLGPVDVWEICPHRPDDRCACRKPRPGLIERAARRLDVAPSRCVVIGDIGADMRAAQAAGARGVLVPTARTRPEEIRDAPEVAPDLRAAVDRALALLAEGRPR